MPELSAPCNSDVSLRTKVDFLLRPESYPERPTRVDATETHMSWVFLTDSHAYKLKKPVRYPFLDFSTVELRRIDCEEEVRLNRRLAPDVYLGVVALGLDPSGRLCVGGGRPVDWLVKMRRLPAERTLQHAIEANAVTQGDIVALARRLAVFYRSARKIDISEPAYRRRFEDEIAASERALLQPSHLMPQRLVGDIAAAQRRFLHRHGELLDRRVRDGRIVEAHGDLRPEHIYLGPAPVVTDCLEFNPSLRVLDPVDELAYLAMECERDGAPLVGSWLFAAYSKATDDVPPAALVAFYTVHCAFLRSRIAISHLDEAEVREPAKWPARTLSYLELAQGYIGSLA